MKVAQLTLLLVLLAACGFAQTVTVKGTVKDSAGKAVPYATVTLKNSAAGAIVAYTETDSKGSFALRVAANTAANGFTIEVRSIGYKTAVKNIASFNAPADFTLAEDTKQLQDVIVKNSRPVLRTNGDTLSYKVSDFSNPQDRVIGDVIKRLPGITVAADGTISYNNKPISNLYIGGDDLLGDRYTVATASVPQGAVANVQVIDNDQHIKALKNKIASTDVALNLTFKKSAKLHVMGQESVGAGLPGNYAATLNAMMFKDKYKAINYLQGNNTGDDIQQNLTAHNLSAYMQGIDNNVPAALLSLGAVNTPALQPSRYLFNQSGILNLNNLVNLKKDVQLKLNAWYYRDNQRQDYSQNITIFLPGDTVRYTETQHNRFKPSMLHTQFTLNINRPNYYLNDVLLMDNNRQPSHGNLVTNGTTVNQTFTDNTLQFSNELNLINTLKSGKIIQLYSYISHSSEPEHRTIGQDYNASIFNNGIPYAQLLQQVNVPTWFTNNYISFKIPLHLSTSDVMVTQSFKTGFIVQSQTLTSELNVAQNDKTVTPMSDSSTNQLHWLRKKIYAEADFDIVGSKLKASLALPVSTQQINYTDSYYALGSGLTRLYFNPQLNMKYQTGNEQYITFQYSYHNQTGTIEDMYRGYILKDYRTLFANNATLAERKNQLANLGFSYRKALTLFFLNANIMYNHTAANNIANQIVTNNLQQQVVLPYPNSTNAFTASITASKYSFPLKTTFGGGVQWQSNSSVQIQNNALLPFNTTTQAVNISADTKVNEHINFSYKAALSQTGSHSTADASAYHVNQLLQQASINYNLNYNWQFKLSGEHYFTRQQGNPDLKYFFADASAKWRVKKWKTDVELGAVNFLNVKTYHALYLSANTLTAGTYALPGRIVMMKVWFNL